MKIEAEEKFLLITRKADEELQKNKSLVDEKAVLIRYFYILYKAFLIFKACSFIM